MVSLDVTRGVGVGARLPEVFPPRPIAREPSRLSGLSTHLAIAALAMAMFPRVLTAAGAPALVNFLHFPMTLGAVMLVAPRMRSRTAKAFVLAFHALLFVVVSSAFLNDAGLVNAVLDFLLLVEPFLLLLLLTSSELPPEQLRPFQRAVLVIASIHVAMAYYQYFVLGLVGDDVKGVFLAQGAGHHVAGAVALTIAAYLLTSTLLVSSVLRVGAASVCASVVYFSDAKQVTLILLASLFILSFRRARLGAVVRRLAVACLASAMYFGVAPALLPNLTGGAGWGSVERMSVGLRHKLSVLPLLESHFRSPLNWLLGLGPGHTCGRLAEMIPDYRAQLEPLGASTSPVTAEVMRLREAHYLSGRSGSSVWSPFFFWSGLFGDLGLAGLTCVLVLWGLVWRHARDGLARLLTINALLLGVVFSWLEEPGYTMFVAAMIGLLWQESLHEIRNSAARPHGARG